MTQSIRPDRLSPSLLILMIKTAAERTACQRQMPRVVDVLSEADSAP